MSNRPNHLFCLHGDLKALACHAWLLPCDANGHVMETWRCALPSDLLDEEHRLKVHRPTAKNRAVQLPDTRSHDLPAPAIWATLTGAVDESDEWYAQGAVAFVNAAGEAAMQALAPANDTPQLSPPPAYSLDPHRSADGHPAAASAPSPCPLRDRDRPLLALPVVGTGAGGAEQKTGEVCKALITQLTAALADGTLKVDVAIVAWDTDTYAALQAVRRAELPCSWPALDASQRTHAKRLATLASDGKLVVFVGAGVSMGAGLPSWGALLAQLWAQVGEEHRPAGFLTLDLLDQAQLLERHFAGSGSALGERVATLIRVHDRHALTHGLLANLPVREFVTTNYDQLLERAAKGMRAELAALPHQASREQERWVLKLHGCVSRPGDIVLSRRSYLRYAARHEALAGIVQALLITRQMLFVGFGLVDDNFVRIVDAVQRAIDAPARDAAAGPRRSAAGEDPRLGYTTWLGDATPLEHLWRGELGWINLPGEMKVAARDLEILLDFVACETTGPAHVLSARQEGALGRELEPLRNALVELRKVAKERPDLPGMARVRQLLSEFGAGKPDTRKDAAEDGSEGDSGVHGGIANGGSD